MTTFQGRPSDMQAHHFNTNIICVGMVGLTRHHEDETIPMLCASSNTTTDALGNSLETISAILGSSK